MMKMTEQTTLAELATYLTALGDPFVTLMKGIDGRRHAVMHSTTGGTFTGHGDTVAEALESVFAAYRRATLPDGLKALLEQEPTDADTITSAAKPKPVGVSLREQTERVMSTLTPREREVLDMRLKPKKDAVFPGTLNHDDVHRWVASSSDYTPNCVQIVISDDGSELPCGQHPAARIHRCHGCGEVEQRHPNDSGCQTWHDGSEHKPKPESLIGGPGWCKVLNRPLPSDPRRPADYSGIPMCSHMVCPKFNSCNGRCMEEGEDFHVDKAGGVCVPEVRDLGNTKAGLKTWLDGAREENAKLDAILRGLVRKHCMTPILNGYSIAVDEAQREEYANDPDGLRLRPTIATTDELQRALDGQLKLLKMANEYLRTKVIASHEEQLRVAEAVRDEARVTSQRYLGEKRELAGELEAAHAVIAQLRTIRFDSLADFEFTGKEVDEAIQLTDMHASEYGELGKALSILRSIRGAMSRRDALRKP